MSLGTVFVAVAQLSIIVPSFTIPLLKLLFRFWSISVESEELERESEGVLRVQDGV